MRYANGATKEISMVPSNTYNEGDYYEFSINGKNTSDKDIIYDIKLNHGINEASPKVRLDDKFLRFRLVTVNNNVETEIIPEIGYESINDTTIHVDTIDKEGTSDVSTTYRLYTWVEGVIVGNVNQDYTTEQWPNVYTNITVDVTGDFQNKSETETLIIEFNAGDGNNNYSSKVYNSGDNYGDLPIPTREGYIFGGWYKESNYQNEVTSNAIVDSENTTLYAKWGAAYIVTLNNYGGTGGSESVTAGYGLAMPSATAPTKYGYNFDGYYSGENGTGTKYYNSSMSSVTNYNIENDTTLYANWVAKTVIVSFDKQNGTGGTNSVTATYNSQMPTSSVTAPTRTGYNFDGYYLNTNGSGTKYYNSSMTSVNNWDKDVDTTIYANWILDVLDENDITFTATSNSIETGSTTNTTVTVTSGTENTTSRTYASSDTSVATVNASGVITGIGAGTTTITVTLHDYGTGIYTKTLSITVVTPPVSSVIAAKAATTGSSYIKSYTTEIINKIDSNFDTQDTYNTNNNKKEVYYFTSTDSSNLAAQYGNVLFGGFCWQIIRTTDTGGIKLLYNGIAGDNQTCLNTRGTTTGLIGVNGTTLTMPTGSSATSVVYGTGYDYNFGNNTITLTNGTDPLITGKTWNNDYKELLGKYTCLNSSNALTTTGTDCQTLVYIGGIYSATSAFITKYTIGTTNHYSELGKSPFNAYYYSLGDVGYMYNTYSKSQNGNTRTSYYSNSVSWSDETNMYIVNTNSSTMAIDDAMTANYHYVCDDATATKTCTKLRYYYYYSGTTYEYVLLESGEINPITAMINGNNVNQKNSAIKGYIDTWYKKNISGKTFESKIDTSAVYCNDRKITSSVGWDASGAIATTYPTIQYYQSTSNYDLRCENTTDRFTADNIIGHKAKLTYPVGLLTEPERKLMNEYYAKSYISEGQTAQYYWSSSPYRYQVGFSWIRGVLTSGQSSDGNPNFASGVRPVITLKPDITLTGSGTDVDPYKVS